METNDTGIILSPELIAVLPKWAKWVARDVDEDIIITNKKPERDGGMWFSVGKKEMYISDFGGINPGTCNWKDSLIKIKR